jgi:hypothetical protein
LKAKASATKKDKLKSVDQFKKELIAFQFEIKRRPTFDLDAEKAKSDSPPNKVRSRNTSVNITHKSKEKISIGVRREDD